MDVTTHKSRVRSISPIRAAGPTLRQSEDTEIVMKNGHVTLNNLQATSSVNPGGTVDVEFTVSNGALHVPGTDDDCCGNCGSAVPSTSAGYSYKVAVSLEGSGSKESPELCLNTTEIGTWDEDHTFDLSAPGTRGSYTLTVELILPGSNSVGSATREVTVEAGGGERPGPGDCSQDNDCPGDYICRDGECVQDDSGGGGGGGGPILPCFLDPNRGCVGPEMFAWIALIMIIITGVVIS